MTGHEVPLRGQPYPRAPWVELTQMTDTHIPVKLGPVGRGTGGKDCLLLGRN